MRPTCDSITENRLRLSDWVVLASTSSSRISPTSLSSCSNDGEAVVCVEAGVGAGLTNGAGSSSVKLVHGAKPDTGGTSIAGRIVESTL